MNKKIRTLIYVLVVGGLMAAAIILFFVARGLRTNYRDNLVDIQTIINAGGDYESNPEYIRLVKLNDGIYNNYQVSATLAYILTILDLVSFGVCLHIADKLKEKEEKDVDAAPVIESKDEEQEVIKNLGDEVLEAPKQEEAEE